MDSLLAVAMRWSGYGGESVASTLAGRLAERFAVTLVTLDPVPEDDLPRAIGPIQALPMVTFSRAGPWAAARQGFYLRQLIRHQRPQAVLSFMTYANVVTAAATLGLSRPPVRVGSEHGLISRILKSENHEAAMRQAVRFLYPTLDRIICVSQASADELRTLTRLPSGRLPVVYNPSPEDGAAAAFSPMPALLVDWLHEVPPVRLVLQVGRLEAAKDPLLALRVMEQLPHEYRLAFVGSGSLRERISMEIERRGLGRRVLLLGHRDDVSAILDHAAAVLHPAAWEGFGLVLVEAAASNVPVVATRVGGIPEVVPRFAPGALAERSPASLAAALARVVVSPPPAAEFEAARARRIAELDPTVVADRYERLIRVNM